MAKRLALTMRMMQTDYGEVRDALAQDWGRFMQAALPGVVWFPIPNLGPATVELAQGLGVDGLILTGGDDWGVFPERDATEKALFAWADGRIPVLGVCRGAQVINRLRGGTLTPVSNHVAVRHEVRLGSNILQVNSFHVYGIAEADLGTGLASLALASDGSVEAFTGDDKLTGLLWHPEREAQPTPHDIRMVRQLFEQG